MTACAREKLFEELFDKDEPLSPSGAPRIFLASARIVDMKTVQDTIAALEGFVDAHDVTGVRRELARLFPNCRSDPAAPSTAWRVARCPPIRAQATGARASLRRQLRRRREHPRRTCRQYQLCHMPWDTAHTASTPAEVAKSIWLDSGFRPRVSAGEQSARRPSARLRRSRDPTSSAAGRSADDAPSAPPSFRRRRCRGSGPIRRPARPEARRGCAGRRPPK